MKRALASGSPAGQVSSSCAVSHQCHTSVTACNNTVTALSGSPARQVSSSCGTTRTWATIHNTATHEFFLIRFNKVPAFNTFLFGTQKVEMNWTTRSSSSSGHHTSQVTTSQVTSFPLLPPSSSWPGPQLKYLPSLRWTCNRSCCRSQLITRAELGPASSTFRYYPLHIVTINLITSPPVQVSRVLSLPG